MGGRVSRKRRTTQSTMAPLLHDFCYVPMPDLIGDSARTTRALILSWSTKAGPDLTDYVERPSSRRRQGQANPYHASGSRFFPAASRLLRPALSITSKGLLLPCGYLDVLLRPPHLLSPINDNCPAHHECKSSGVAQPHSALMMANSLNA